jgi:hypothetical protein
MRVLIIRSISALDRICTVPRVPQNFIDTAVHIDYS